MKFVDDDDDDLACTKKLAEN